jgi:hypothetical protein
MPFLEDEVCIIAGANVGLASARRFLAEGARGEAGGPVRAGGRDDRHGAPIWAMAS